MSHVQLTLSLLDESFSVCRLAPGTGIPQWLPTDVFCSITRSDEELSIVCPSDAVPDNVRTEGGFRALKVEGPLDFSLTGILVAVIGPLADNGIPIFALSTYDTDYILVQQHDLEKAASILRAAGHTLRYPKGFKLF